MLGENPIALSERTTARNHYERADRAHRWPPTPRRCRQTRDLQSSAGRRRFLLLQLDMEWDPWAGSTAPNALRHEDGDRMGRASNSDRVELQFALTDQVHEQAMQLLFEPDVSPELPEQGFIGIIVTATGIRRRTLVLRRILSPLPDDLHWKRGLGFSPAYFSRALDAISNEPRGTGI